ncbi:MAG: phosphoribosylanthranilate isomerase [Gammaproteobacteria bacterium]
MLTHWAWHRSNNGGSRVRTRVKICGITRPEDGVAAAELGADAIGLVFHPHSPRAVSIDQANAVVEALPPFVTVVALFVDAPQAAIRSVLEAVPVDLLQFHGAERAPACTGFARRYIKAISMRPGLDVAAAMADHPDAAAFLLDAFHPAVAGGSGQRFDWERVPGERPRPVILAGGLDPGNVVEAIRRVRPYGVDVSSGVEAAKGVKDPVRLRQFIEGVRHVDADPSG